MRIPSSVLSRVRGPLAAAALAGCASPAAAPPPAPIAPVAAAPAPIDPIAYASADEDARLARVDGEAIAALDVREARVGRLASVRRRSEIQQALRSVDWQNTSGDPNQVGIGTIGNLGRFNCAGCGRG